MSAGTPDTSLLSKLLRERMAAGPHSLTSAPLANRAPLPEQTEQRSSAVIGALMRDTRDAYEQHQLARSAAEADGVEPEVATDASVNTELTDPDDLSAFMLSTLNNCDWQDWVSARCDFPDKGPFLSAGCENALAAVAELTQQVFRDAGEDGDDLTVEVFAESVSGSARLTVSGQFGLSMKTLKMIMQSRSDIEAIGGALITVRESTTAGFEALIPGR